VQDYYSLAKFNVMELANKDKMSDIEHEGRMPENKHIVRDDTVVSRSLEKRSV
jgi:hypothetical protein